MENKQRGVYEIHLDKPRKIRFTFTALDAMQEKMGRQLHEIDENTARIGDMVTMLWAGLLKYENLSYEEVDELLTEAAEDGRLDEVMEVVQQALARVMGQAKGNGKEARTSGKK